MASIHLRNKRMSSIELFLKGSSCPPMKVDRGGGGTPVVTKPPYWRLCWGM